MNLYGDSSNLSMKWVLTNFIDKLLESPYRFIGGFADEIGSDSYNYSLSERRAESVAEFLRNHGLNVRFGIEAHGRIKLSPEEVKEEIEYHRWPEGGIDWIQVNRRARRVEIYNKR